MALCCLPFISSGCKQSETTVKESSISDALYQNLPFEMPKVQQPVFPAYEVNIEKFKYLIMLDLDEKDLAKLASDGKVRKFMNEVKKVNENPDFFNYMTKEEDEEKCHNTELKEATEAGLTAGIDIGKKEAYENMAKEMLQSNMPMKDIIKISKLSEEEILKLKNNM